MVKKLLSLGLLITTSFAFGAGEIVDPNFKPVPEVTDERLKKDQMLQATMPEVKNAKPEAPKPVAVQMGNETAQANMAQASAAFTALQDATAANGQKPGGPSWVNIGLVLSSLAVLGFGAKAWVDKAVPGPQPKKTSAKTPKKG